MRPQRAFAASVSGVGAIATPLRVRHLAAAAQAALPDRRASQRRQPCRDCIAQRRDRVAARATRATSTRTIRSAPAHRPSLRRSSPPARATRRETRSGLRCRCLSRSRWNAPPATTRVARRRRPAPDPRWPTDSRSRAVAGTHRNSGCSEPSNSASAVDTAAIAAGCTVTCVVSVSAWFVLIHYRQPERQDRRRS